MCPAQAAGWVHPQQREFGPVLRALRSRCSTSIRIYIFNSSWRGERALLSRAPEIPCRRWWWVGGLAGSFLTFAPRLAMCLVLASIAKLQLQQRCFLMETSLHCSLLDEPPFVTRVRTELLHVLAFREVDRSSCFGKKRCVAAKAEGRCIVPRGTWVSSTE